MTREKKLEIQKYKEKTKDMTVEQKKVYDRLLDMQKQYESLVYELHTLIFPEEYDFMYDSNVEVQERKNGKNPMRESYIKRINEKREKLGVVSLHDDGMPSAGAQESSMEYCKKLLEKKVEIF